jgi:hypothetical protein
MRAKLLSINMFYGGNVTSLTRMPKEVFPPCPPDVLEVCFPVLVALSGFFGVVAIFQCLSAAFGC